MATGGAVDGNIDAGDAGGRGRVVERVAVRRGGAVRGEPLRRPDGDAPLADDAGDAGPWLLQAP